MFSVPEEGAIRQQLAAPASRIAGQGRISRPADAGAFMGSDARSQQNNNAFPNDALANTTLAEKEKDRNACTASAIAESPINDPRYTAARFTPKHVNSVLRLSTCFSRFPGLHSAFEVLGKTVNTRRKKIARTAKRRAENASRLAIP